MRVEDSTGPLPTGNGQRGGRNKAYTNTTTVTRGRGHEQGRGPTAWGPALESCSAAGEGQDGQPSLWPQSRKGQKETHSKETAPHS